MKYIGQRKGQHDRVGDRPQQGKNGLHQGEQPPTTAGFTLIETVLVTALMGILATIASASWLSFSNTWHLNAAQDEVFQVMKLAQSQSKAEQRRWQASFRNTDSQVEWAIYPVRGTQRGASDDVTWRSLRSGVHIDSDETTLYQSTDDVYHVRFNHSGHVNGRLGRLTLVGQPLDKARRCVVVATLLGTVRKAENRTRPQNGRYCY